MTDAPNIKKRPLPKMVVKATGFVRDAAPKTPTDKKD